MNKIADSQTVHNRMHNNKRKSGIEYKHTQKIFFFSVSFFSIIINQRPISEEKEKDTQKNSGEYHVVKKIKWNSIRIFILNLVLHNRQKIEIQFIAQS